MSAREPVKLSLLRDIGWSEWDPLGLNGSEGGWQRSEAANEYDRYMQKVAGGLQAGQPERTLVDYLVNIETTHMGLTPTPATRLRAETTVAAIAQHVETNC